MSDSILSQKNIQKNKLGQSTSKKQFKIFKFQKRVLAFSARLSALMTVIRVFDGNSFFFIVVRQHIESKNIKKKIPRRKIEEIIFVMFSELV
jgi:di/tricarboxylate transporter